MALITVLLLDLKFSDRNNSKNRCKCEFALSIMEINYFSGYNRYSNFNYVLSEFYSFL
jgi:hypothetical protein